MITQSVPPISFAVVAMSTTVRVRPEPEKITITSSLPNEGVIVSPTTYDWSPRCIRRMAKAFATSPERPAPITKTRRAPRMAPSSRSTSSSSIRSAICAMRLPIRLIQAWTLPAPICSGVVVQVS